MAAQLDQDTLDRLRTMPCRQAFDEVKNAVYRAGTVSSEDFLDLYQQLVDHGILSWDQIEEFDA